VIFPPRFLDAEKASEYAKALAPPPPASADEIVTPMGGAYYGREAPHLPPIVNVGDHFEVGQPLFIIEVMKMFNKVLAPFAGTVTEDLMAGKDGTVVAKGQRIFAIEPDVRVEPESEAARAARAAPPPSRGCRRPMEPRAAGSTFGRRPREGPRAENLDARRPRAVRRTDFRAPGIRRRLGRSKWTQIVVRFAEVCRNPTPPTPRTRHLRPSGSMRRDGPDPFSGSPLDRGRAPTARLDARLADNQQVPRLADEAAAEARPRSPRGRSASSSRTSGARTGVPRQRRRDRALRRRRLRGREARWRSGSSTSRRSTTCAPRSRSARRAAIAAHARTLVDWHARHRHCAACGGHTRSVLGGANRVCFDCQAEHFPRTDPVAIAVVVRGNQCLLGRGPGWPAQMFSALAGFVEAGESLEDAVRREVLEESSVRVGRVTYLASQPWPFPCSLMLGCVAQAESEAIAIDPAELEEARWFSRDALRQAAQPARIAKRKAQRAKPSEARPSKQRRRSPQGRDRPDPPPVRDRAPDPRVGRFGRRRSRLTRG
jgi:NADH pyrophosphatase NudC (nudix superfamily)/biotin carboxyl carrier protein